MNILPFPLIWRKILYSYLRGVTLAVASFVLILLTLKINEIAHFATLGIQTKTLLLFTFYQIVSILPFALPIGSFISSFLLTESLVETHELTAFRALGLSLRDLFFPLFFAATFFSFVNFILVSEFSSQSSLSINALKEEIRAVNPLLLLQNKQLLKLKGILAVNLNPSKSTEIAKNTVLSIPTKQKEPLLILAKELRCINNKLCSKNLSFIVPLKNELIVENTLRAETTTDLLPKIFYDEKIAPKSDHFQLIELFKKVKNKKIVITEILKRVSSGLSVVTFTLMAISFALTNQRIKTKKNLLISLVLIAICLLTTILAKETKQSIPLTAFLLFAPQGAILLLSFRKIHLFSKGEAS